MLTRLAKVTFALTGVSALAIGAAEAVDALSAKSAPHAAPTATPTTTTPTTTHPTTTTRPTTPVGGTPVT